MPAQAEACRAHCRILRMPSKAARCITAFRLKFFRTVSDRSILSRAAQSPRSATALPLQPDEGHFEAKCPSPNAHPCEGRPADDTEPFCFRWSGADDRSSAPAGLSVPALRWSGAHRALPQGRRGFPALLPSPSIEAGIIKSQEVIMKLLRALFLGLVASCAFAHRRCRRRSRWGQPRRVQRRSGRTASGTLLLDRLLRRHASGLRLVRRRLAVRVQRSHERQRIAGRRPDRLQLADGPAGLRHRGRRLQQLGGRQRGNNVLRPYRRLAGIGARPPRPTAFDNRTLLYVTAGAAWADIDYVLDRLVLGHARRLGGRRRHRAHAHPEPERPRRIPLLRLQRRTAPAGTLAPGSASSIRACRRCASASTSNSDHAVIPASVWALGFRDDGVYSIACPTYRQPVIVLPHLT